MSAELFYIDSEKFTVWTPEDVQSGQARMLRELDELRQGIESGTVVGIFGIVVHSEFDTHLIDLRAGSMKKLTILGALHRMFRDLSARCND